MDRGLLVILALGVGLVVGAVLAVMLILAARAGRAAVAVSGGSLPSGIEAVLDAMTAPAVLVDASNAVAKVSAAAEGAGLVSSVGAGVQVHPEVLALAQEVRRGGETAERELVVVRGGRADAVRHLRATGTLVGVRYVLVVADDRTESVRLDEVRRDFVANVSHELKTPIGAVSLLAEALESAAEDPAQVRRFAERLSTEAARLSTLTQDIIELSRVQGGQLPAQADIVSVGAILSNALDQNRVAAEAKSIELVSGGAKGLAVAGNEQTLVTAVHNLIANAVQYAPERSRVGVGATRRGDLVEIAVTDQGPGIPEEEQERIFERFFRSDPARSRNTGGTGLGLSIVKHAVANHGGEIRVWSQPGQGSTFTILLPVAEGTVTR